jgi:hypothetical protein
MIGNVTKRKAIRIADLSMTLDGFLRTNRRPSKEGLDGSEH